MLLDIQIYISEYCLVKVYDKNNDNQNERHIDQHKRQRYLQVLPYKGRGQPQSGRQDTSLATPPSSKSFISSEHLTQVALFISRKNILNSPQKVWSE